MSYCQLIQFKDGKPDQQTAFRNAWGGAARIWDALFKAYVPKKHEFDSWLTGGSEDRRLWDLAKREDLPMFERAVHASTFDLCYVRKEHFKRFADDLRQFVLNRPAESGHVCHLKAWADLIESSPAEAIGFHGTSFSENLWHRYDSEKDESTPVSLSEGFEVYDWLNSLSDGGGRG